MEETMADQNDYVKGLVLGMIIGGTVGAVTSLLLAPKSGAELRQDIAERSADIYGKSSEFVDRTVTNTVNEGKTRAKNIIDSARRQAESLLTNAEQILNDVKTKATDGKEAITEKIDTVRNAAKASADTFRTEMNS